MSNRANIEIPLVDLEEFIFSPPGAMGWSESEYQKVLEQEPDASMTNFSNLYNIRKNAKKLTILPNIDDIEIHEPSLSQNEEEKLPQEAQEEIAEVPHLELVEDSHESEEEIEEYHDIEEESDHLYEPYPEIRVAYRMATRRLKPKPYRMPTKRLKPTPALGTKK
ncbi:hypothetical protein [Alkalihalobacillus sp. TS-13]|uniref:hypothetical protein n=1 Tax=Alkalihalobacillus sp. TS-13 TaxID=2842455 RepID=UPI001C87179E|nr:hypothetical protein [Alkalihalobacillus sp. TS-13]